MRKCYRFLLICLLVSSMIQVEIRADKNKPIYPLLVYNEQVEWSELEEVWIDRNVYLDNWVFAIQDATKREKIIDLYQQPVRTPVHKTIVIKLRENYYLRQETYVTLGMAMVVEAKQQRRLVLVNVDNSPAT